MSTLKVNDIQEATSGGGKIFLSRAWADWNAVTSSLNDDGNVSSLTDNGTGNFTVNFTNNMPSSTYSFVSGATMATDGTVGGITTDNGYNSALSNKTTSSMRHRLGRASTPGYTDFYNASTAYID